MRLVVKILTQVRTPVLSVHVRAPCHTCAYGLTEFGDGVALSYRGARNGGVSGECVCAESPKEWRFVHIAAESKIQRE